MNPCLSLQMSWCAEVTKHADSLPDYSLLFGCEERKRKKHRVLYVPNWETRQRVNEVDNNYG